MTSAVLTRPTPDSPLYELRQAGDHYLLVPYYSEPDAARDMTPREAAEWVATVRNAGGEVIGDARAITPFPIRKDA